MIKEAIVALAGGRSLSNTEAVQVMEEIMEGKATPAQLGAFLTALSMKGETADEIAGLARVMREKAIQVKAAGPVLDIVGTGGDGLNTFNISTAAALVAAASGVRVAKHGNRAATSQCGSADVLEKLGVRIDLTAEGVRECLQKVGLGFMFAPAFHPSMKYAAGPRREIGIRTVFNILGPLTNPAHAEYQVIGVPSPGLAEKIVPALIKLGTSHALVVHGLNGMDEISISGGSLIWEVEDGRVTSSRRSLSPEDFGLTRAADGFIGGGTPEENARTILRVLSGARGPQRDIVVLNAAAALVAGNQVETFRQGAELAQTTLDKGLALAKLQQLIKFTGQLAGN
jgi:anthranilate phosphoribosyltransferase